jgi:hypothetical protein
VFDFKYDFKHPIGAALPFAPVNLNEPVDLCKDFFFYFEFIFNLFFF